MPTNISARVSNFSRNMSKGDLTFPKTKIPRAHIEEHCNGPIYRRHFCEYAEKPGCLGTCGSNKDYTDKLKTRKRIIPTPLESFRIRFPIKLSPGIYAN